MSSQKSTDRSPVPDLKDRLVFKVSSLLPKRDQRVDTEESDCVVAEETQNITKSMLIIKSGPTALKGVEQFLRNRDWALYATHELKDAIAILTTKKPSFVLVLVDHPNQKIRKLPKIILSAFQTCVMVYAERATTVSYKLLMDSGMEYKINPPVTGPAIERAVNKFIRDREQAAKQLSTDAHNAENAKNNFEFNVEIKGSATEKGPSFISMNKQANPEDVTQEGLAQSLLSQLNNDDWDAFKAGSTTNDPEPPKSPGSFSLKSQGPQTAEEKEAEKSRAQLKTYRPDHTESLKAQASGGAMINLQQLSPQAQAAADAAAQIALEKGTPRSEGKGILQPSYNPQAPKKKGPPGEFQIGEAQKKSANSQTEDFNPEAARDLYVPPPQTAKTPQALNPELEQKKKPEVLIGREIEDLKPKRQLPVGALHIRENGSFDRESVLVKGVDQSLELTVMKGDGKVTEVLQDNTNLACIVIESSRFSGYLVAALGKDKKLDHHFIDLIKVKLFRFLRDNGETVDDESNLNLKINQVNFEGWALEYAQFLKKSVHKGDEVAMAFFPFAATRTQVEESASEKMVSVKTADIQTDIALEFNLYLYLPFNKKYILYAPEGGKLLGEQKERLVRQGMNRLHIQKADVQNLSKFKAQNHLNSLIKDYETKSAPSAANENSKKKKAA